MRPKDSGTACSTVSRTARTTAGWVTTTVRPGRTAAVRSQAPLAPLLKADWTWRVDGTVAPRHAHFRARVLPQAHGRPAPS